MDAVDRVGAATASERLELELDLLDRRRIQQLAELVGAQQLREELPVQRECLGATFGERRVPLIHVGADVVE